MKGYREKDYSDMIDMQHPTSKTHPRMSLHARAAQFAPFAALTGHGEAIRETERMTEPKVCLGEDQVEELDAKFRELAGMLACGELPFVTVAHFVPDKKKEGGAYCEKRGHVVKVDVVKRTILFEDRDMVPIANIRELHFGR